MKSPTRSGVENGPRSVADESSQSFLENEWTHESQAILAAIVESSTDAIIGKNLDGVITTWNAAAERIFGYAADEAIGRPITLILPPDRLAEEREILAKLRRGERVEHFETVRMAKDGQKLDVSMTISPIRNAAGEIIGASKIARDITERKRIQAALSESRGRLDFVAHSAELGIWYWDLPTNKLEWNTKYKEHFGLPPETDPTLEKFYECLHPSDREHARRAIEVALKNCAKLDLDYRTVAPDGRLRWVHAVGGARCDEAGRPVRFDGITVDVTDRKRVEEDLQRSKELLGNHALELEKRVAERTASMQASIQSLENVLYHVAHDLRAPLRAMQGFTTILAEEYGSRLDETAQDYTRRIVSGASRMDKLIQDLLEYGRLAHAPLNFSRVDLEPRLDAALISLDEMIKDKRAQVRVRWPLSAVWADPKVLEQLLFNLLENALQFVAPGVAPVVRIWAEQNGPETVRLWLEDNGIGIEPEHQERVFRVFERLHSGNDYSGTGIGLAIVQKGAERMSGRAGVQSMPGEGSRFWLELPAALKREP